MNRRDFIAASALAGGAPLVRAMDYTHAMDDAMETEYYELRHYHMLYGAKQRQLHDFLGEVALPAFKRLNIGPVGAFTVVYGTNAPSLLLLLPHSNLASVETLRQRLAEDDEYQKAGADFLKVPMSDPAYVRFESTLLKAFVEMPKLETPLNSPGRIFEMRTYESHSDAAALRKIEMFNKGGEIPIFRRTGLNPVFFAETLIGRNMPNLTYMLVFEDMQARDEAWDQFRQDPDWEKLRVDPYYADTVSTISDVILRPTAYSQI